MFNQIREPAADTTKPSREVHCCESSFSRTTFGIKDCISLGLHGISDLTISVHALETAEDLVVPESKKLYATPRQSQFVPEGLGY